MTGIVPMIGVHSFDPQPWRLLPEGGEASPAQVRWTELSYLLLWQFTVEGFGAQG